jgi:hypothetical protein
MESSGHLAGHMKLITVRFYLDLVDISLLFYSDWAGGRAT